ncbi:MAG: glycosyltransferase family 4 protein [Solirubrobacteraceae bacterium]
MRVLLDTTFAARTPYSGTAVYLERLQAACSRLDDLELVPACNVRRRAPAGGGVGSVRNLLADQWWTAVELPRLARRAHAELIHHPLPARSPGAGMAQVVTVHDLAFERLPEGFDRSFRLYAHQHHRAAAAAASAVICVSETTAADVRALWGVAAERIVVACHGPGQEPAAAARPSPEHFLYVGDDEPRKDLPTLLAAYRDYRDRTEDPLGLVLAGSCSGDGAGVRLEHRPSAARLARLYAGAVALVHPSLYEGFGLTALEAMSAGTPVLAARSPGLTEVCGDAARYADPGDARSLAAGMAEIAASGSVQRELARRGSARAAQFSWAASARAHRETYALALRR